MSQQLPPSFGAEPPTTLPVARPFRADVSRLDRLRQRFWATRVRLFLHLRRDGASKTRKRGR